jgi:hypothetical protein
MSILDHQEAGFNGTITNTSLHDLIQLICIGRNSCRMRVKSGYLRGTITFRDGEIIHAETQDLMGEDALFSILSWELGSFECDHNVNVQETIQENWDFLLMESLRRLDATKNI